ncbi:MAG: hypothetical protein AB8C84_00130 [Oligoflexales bacterium]
MKQVFVFLLCFLSVSGFSQDTEKSVAQSSSYEVTVMFTGYADFEWLHYGVSDHVQVGVGSSVFGSLLNTFAYGSYPPLFLDAAYFVSGYQNSSWYGKMVFPAYSAGPFYMMPPTTVGYRWKFDDGFLNLGVMAVNDSHVVPEISWGVAL